MPAQKEFDERVAKMFRASRFAEYTCAAHPHVLPLLRERGDAPFDLEREATALARAATAEALDAALRDLRRRAMLHIMYRDLNGLATLDEVVTTVSALAATCIARAVGFHEAAVANLFGLAESTTPHQRLLVVGMGKLGGSELNVSSDVDLVFIHHEDGGAAAGRSWHEFHCEIGKRVIRSLDAVTTDGFVFRTDMRLRPFGASGPLVSSLASLESYFVTQARPWERYAWLKGLALTGHPDTRTELDALVTPFVYRRYHDYGAIDDIRALHAQIRVESGKRRAQVDDIKLGRGGIRELEFVAQMFQLIRGGRERSLQRRSTRRALDAIAELGILPPERVRALQTAYEFMRNLEHRLQYLDDAQTQSLPVGDDERTRIADAMGYPDWQPFLAELDRHRAIVLREFESLFAAPAPNARAGADVNGDLAQHCESLLGRVELPAERRSNIIDRVRAWQLASRTQSLSAKSRQRMEALIPLALEAALRFPGDARNTFFRLFDLIDAIDKREAYLALLVEFPAVLERITRIASQSAFAADFLKKHPVLMDELLDAREANAPIDWHHERTKLREACDVAEGDVERQYEILRHTKQVLTLKLNVADLDGRLSVMALSDDLTALADLLLDTSLTLAARALKLKPAHDWNAVGGFAVLAYGKYGSKELGYASDLDLVFIADEHADGAAYARLAQRVLSWLNTMTPGGVLYDTDLRLRPDGDAGLMVSRLSAFADYQQQRAWLWEHQALTRARWCAGDPTLKSPFDAIRAEILARARDTQALRVEVNAMRDKMRADKKDAADRLDLKHTKGGIVDVEFIVQYLILAHSNEHPEFLGNLGNFALLTRAAALGLLDETLATSVGKAYLAFRERQHRARTNNEAKTLIAPTELVNERKTVTEAWRALLG